MIISTIRILAAAAAAAGAALAQPAPERASIEPEQHLLERIDELQAKEGPTAEALIEPLRTLALLHEEAGDHVLAVVALEQARQVMRARRGLFAASVEEAELLRQQIRNEKALGNGERVWNLQQDLMVIARQNLDDLRMLPIFRELIDDRTERLDEFSTTDFLDLRPGIYVPCDTGAAVQAPYGDKRGAPVAASDARNCPFGTWKVVVDRLREEILVHHAEAIEVIVKNGDYASRELRDLERQALRLVPFRGFATCAAVTVNQLLASDLVGTCLEPIRRRGEVTLVNVGGWGSLMRLIAYEIHSGAPAAARANAVAELADWYLKVAQIDQRSSSAIDELGLALYEWALAELQQGEDARESMARIFSPELPVTLPTYAPNSLESTKSSRYIDAAFAITKSGTAEQIEVQARSANATRADERDLIRLIKFTSFRPRAVDGQLAASAPVVVRYYLPENPTASAVSAR